MAPAISVASLTSASVMEGSTRSRTRPAARIRAVLDHTWVGDRPCVRDDVVDQRWIEVEEGRHDDLRRNRAESSRSTRKVVIARRQAQLVELLGRLRRGR